MLHSGVSDDVLTSQDSQRTATGADPSLFARTKRRCDESEKAPFKRRTIPGTSLLRVGLRPVILALL